ncbi:MAG: excinuclease ABC subunit C, partial [Treponema sp.]|nr:excinuclease ABC subunit C [Treponema sp.]
MQEDEQEQGPGDPQLSPAQIREQLHQTALKAPELSGVYLWKNAAGTVLYVGKAKSLKNRLSSYFTAGRDIKTRLLVSRARSIEYITTNNEYEAFLLENNLIKKYTPRYNIDLKDGKSYPVLRVTKETYPRVFKTRRVVQDGSLYFGPFPDAGALDTFIDTLYEIYPLRHCKTFRVKSAPCLYYHIGRCLAPCCKKIDASDYRGYIDEVIALVEGCGTQDALVRLESQMKDAAARMDFEKAARIRDGLKALSVLHNQNSVEGFDGDDRDYLASWREGELVSFTVLKIRTGKLLGRDNYRTVSLNEDTELLPE